MPKRKLVQTGEIAPLLGVSTRAIARYVKDGKLRPATRSLGGHYRWDVDDTLRQWNERDKHNDQAPQ